MEYAIDYNTAYNAHAGTSFSPEKRAQQEQGSFRGEIEEIKAYFLSVAETDDQKEKALELADLYAEKYTKKYTDYLHCRSGLMSTMITGRSNFPVARMEKKNEVLHNRSNDLENFRRSKRAKYARIIKNLKPQGYNELDELRQKLSDMEKFQAGMKKANSLVRKLSKQSAKVKDFNEAFEKESGLTIAFMDQMSKWNDPPHRGYESFMLTNHNAKIKTLKAKVEKLAQQETAVSADSQEVVFDGGYYLLNQAENRLQIFFDGMPEKEIRTELKSRGFRWSRKFEAWQRQLTDNAVYATQNLSFIKN